MKIKIFLLLCTLFYTQLQAQFYVSRNGQITFTSEAPLERIEAFTQSANSVLDLAGQQIEFAVLIKSFQFQKALMQQHFNENYMESDQYPKGVFKGSFLGFDTEKSKQDGVYPIEIEGEMTIHGVSKPVACNGILKVRSSEIMGEAELELEVADFDIKIPAIVREKIAKTVKIKVEVAYQEYQKNSK